MKDNRPQRCGQMSAALTYIEIMTRSMADNYTTPELFVKGLREISAFASKTLEADEILRDAVDK